MYLVSMGRGCAWPSSLLLAVTLRAQVPDTTVHALRLLEHHDEITLLVGYHQGRYGFAEVGLGRNQFGHTRHPYDIGYHAGAELRVDRPELWGVKVGAYVGGASALGVQLIQYVQGADGCTVLRPEIGIGTFKFKWTYAYNLALSRPRLEGISTHMMSLTYALRLKRLPKDDQRNGRG